MDMNKYFKELNSKLDNLSNDELEALLIQSGIENYPFEDDTNKPINFNALIDNQSHNKQS